MRPGQILGTSPVILVYPYIKGLAQQKPGWKCHETTYCARNKMCEKASLRAITPFQVYVGDTVPPPVLTYLESLFSFRLNMNFAT